MKPQNGLIKVAIQTIIIQINKKQYLKLPHRPTISLPKHTTTKALHKCGGGDDDERDGRACVRLVIPRRKQIPSRMLDLPLPLSPVMALNSGSKPLISVRWAYDLKPSMAIDFMNIALDFLTLTLFSEEKNTKMAQKYSRPQTTHLRQDTTRR